MVLVLFFLGLMIASMMVDWSVIFCLLMFFTFFLGLGGYSEMTVWGSNFYFGFDVLSWSLVVLSVWITGLMLLASYKAVNSKSGIFFVNMVIVLCLFLSLTFMVLDYLYFYVFFEGSLIPIFLLVMGWGYQPERLQAGLYLLFYTLFGSLPLLIAYMFMFSWESSLFYNSFYMCSFDGLILLLGLIFGFLVKMPMFTVHLWLPKAHVEAPISGSMMLAGVLLKLGGYGILRVMWILSATVVKFNVIFISLSLISFSLVSLICMRQSDLKSLIAYSSVAHMSLVISGLMILNDWGVRGSLGLMLGHGLCSSGLFCLANVMYERLGSRSLLVNSGLLLLFPGMCLWWFMLSVCNMAAPPSINLLGEISLMISIVGWFSWTMILLFFGSFLSGCYTIYMYSLTQHGRGGAYNPLNNCDVREYYLMLYHWVPLNFFVLKFDSFFWLF